MKLLFLLIFFSFPLIHSCSTLSKNTKRLPASKGSSTYSLEVKINKGIFSHNKWKHYDGRDEITFTVFDPEKSELYISLTVPPEENIEFRVGHITFNAPNDIGSFLVEVVEDDSFFDSTIDTPIIEVNSGPYIIFADRKWQWKSIDTKIDDPFIFIEIKREP